MEYETYFSGVIYVLHVICKMLFRVVMRKCSCRFIDLFTVLLIGTMQIRGDNINCIKKAILIIITNVLNCIVYCRTN